MAELGRASYDNLIAGDYPLKATEIIIQGPTQFKRGDVIGLNTADGSYAPVDSAKDDGTQEPIGVICDDIVAEDGETTVTTMYIKGEFSSRYLNFGGTDTVDTHRKRMTEIGLLIKNTKI